MTSGNCVACFLPYIETTPTLLQCENCSECVHAKCCGLSNRQYSRYENMEDEELFFYCPRCSSTSLEFKESTLKILKNLGAYPETFNNHIKYYVTIESEREKEEKSSNKENSGRGRKRNANSSSSDNDSDSQKKINRSRYDTVHGAPIVIAKPPEPYMMFRNIVQATHPFMPKEKLQKFAVQEWLKLSAAEKAKYKCVSDKHLLKYRKETIYHVQTNYEAELDKERKRRRLVS